MSNVWWSEYRFDVPLYANMSRFPWSYRIYEKDQCVIIDGRTTRVGTTSWHREKVAGRNIFYQRRKPIRDRDTSSSIWSVVFILHDKLYSFSSLYRSWLSEMFLYSQVRSLFTIIRNKCFTCRSINNRICSTYTTIEIITDFPYIQRRLYSISTAVVSCAIDDTSCSRITSCTGSTASIRTTVSSATRSTTACVGTSIEPFTCPCPVTAICLKIWWCTVVTQYAWLTIYTCSIGRTFSIYNGIDRTLVIISS